MTARTPNLLRPPAVRSDARFSIVSPASTALPDRISAGLDALRCLGFDPVPAPNALVRGPLYFAGTPERRVADLHEAFSDPGTGAVMCLRGGYGSNYLLDHLDLELFASHPKPFFAYSDLTGIQLHLLDRLGLPAFHGPMLAADFYRPAGIHLESFRASLSGDPFAVGTNEGLRILEPGNTSSVQGTLYGGCLSIIVSLLGTPWEPHTEGTLLFLEDTGAKPYQIDRMIWQLRSAKKLDGVRGIIFGEMLDCASPGASSDLLEKAILSALSGFDGPVAFGLRSGHVSRENVTLTFGVQAQLTVGSEPRLNILEPAVTR